MEQTLANPASRASSQTRPLDFECDGAVRVWVGAICFVLVLLVSIGGITRLTGSGLSITDWKPIMGAIPPLTENAWLEVFQKYQEIPQYKIVNHQMTLSEFKSIYFWEWLHRLIARAIGLVVLIPAVFFWVRNRISSRVLKRTLIGFALGGLQGAMGWFMVMSGLSERVSVSHFRLAAHLSLALLILAYFTYLLRDLQTKRTRVEPNSAPLIQKLFRITVALFCFQVVYGAFVAGLKAGWGFNTWPKMNGEWIPSSFFALEGGTWVNLLSNPAAVHWIHRTNGILLILGALGLWRAARKPGTAPELRRATISISHGIIAQFWVGVVTVILVVPISLAVFHQFFAALLVMGFTVLGHTLYRAKSSC